jgi:uncharacterized protein YecT (DUF1311 family)
MPRPVTLCALVVAFASVAGPSHADELDEWCAQAKKASSIVICSDAGLRQQAIARNKLFEAARAKLSSEAYKALSDDQSRWIKSYTARCGISIDDPPPPMPIPQSVIDCYRHESSARTAYLADRLLVQNPTASIRPETPSTSEPLGPASSSAESHHAPPVINPFDRFDPAKPRPDYLALDEWRKCLMDAAGGLADQLEPAQTIVDAAFGFCGKYEAAANSATVGTGKIDHEGFDRIKKEALVPSLLARVMAVRKARQEATKSAPAPSSKEASDNDLDKWVECTLAAVDTLADQPEPAQTVADAVFGSCLTEQFAYQKSAGVSDRQLEADKAAIMFPRVLAQVMAVRAARAKLREESPKARPAIDYDHM